MKQSVKKSDKFAAKIRQSMVKNEEEEDEHRDNSLRRSSTLKKQQELFVGENSIHLSKSVVSQGEGLIQKADSEKK